MIKGSIVCKASLFPLVLLFWVPLAYLSGLPLGILSAKYFLLVLSSAICVPFIFFHLKVLKNASNWIDILVVGLVLYVVSVSLISGINISEEKKIVCLIASSLVYFYIRVINLIFAENVFINGLFFYGITGVALISLIVGLLQAAGTIPSFNSTFEVTGTFFHPAPFTAFLACSFPFIYLSSINSWTKVHNTTAQVVLLAVCLLTLILSLVFFFMLKSRASVLSLFVGTGYVLYHVRTGFKSHWLEKTRAFFSSGYKKLAIILLITGCTCMAYWWRKDSVNGRLLVWKISLNMIANRPLIGHGFGSFQYDISKYQMAYFKSSNPSESEINLADEVTSAFNEPLQLLSELGTLGLSIFILIVVFVYRDNKIYQINASKGEPVMSRLCLSISAKGSLLAFLVFSLFSYPFSLPELTCVFFISLALANNNNSHGAWIFPFVKTFTYAFTLYMILTINKRFVEFQAYRTWQNAANQTDSLSMNKLFKAALVPLKHNNVFLHDYSQRLYRIGNYRECISILGKEKTMHYDDYMVLAECNRLLDNNNLYEKSLIDAHYLLPNRFTPVFKLMLLYHDSVKNARKVILYANELLNKKVRVPSLEIDHFKAVARDYIKNSSKD